MMLCKQTEDMRPDNNPSEQQANNAWDLNAATERGNAHNDCHRQCKLHDIREGYSVRAYEIRNVHFVAQRGFVCLDGMNLELRSR
jgi:hypothetical protein